MTPTQDTKTLPVFRFTGDWFTAEDADTMAYPHDIAGHVVATDIRSAIDQAERLHAVNGERVVVHSIEVVR